MGVPSPSWGRSFQVMDFLFLTVGNSQTRELITGSCVLAMRCRAQDLKEAMEKRRKEGMERREEKVKEG